MTTARAITGSTGEYLQNGFDLDNLTVAEPSQGKIDYWKREVTYRYTKPLQAILTEDRHVMFDLVARKVVESGVDKNTTVDVYSSGSVREIRVGKKRFRTYENTFLGKR